MTVAMSSTVLAEKISLPELARRWGWSQGRLYRLVAAEAIPHLRIGRQVYFEPSALEAWLEAHRRGGVKARESERPLRARRNREEECARLGIPTMHEFS